LLRCWSHTWQRKTTKKKQKSDTPNSQSTKSFSMPHYTVKEGGLPHWQRLAPNLLGRCSMQYSHSHPWDKPGKHPRKTDPHPAKKAE
jgi:hypothetical protein